MKHKLIILTAFSLLLCSCGAFRQTPEEKQHIAQVVSQRLDAMDFRIDIDYMMPLRGGGKAVTGGYSITVNGTTLNSHLPYLGVAQRVPYGGGKALNFEDEIDEYTDSGWYRGKRTITLLTNNDEDIIVYTLTLFDNAQADVQVHCRNRDDISYRGNLDTAE